MYPIFLFFALFAGAIRLSVSCPAYIAVNHSIIIEVKSTGLVLTSSTKSVSTHKNQVRNSQAADLFHM